MTDRTTIKQLAVGLLIAALVWAGPALALKYMSIKQAVTRFLPSGAKVTKITKEVTPEIRKRLLSDYGWRPDQEKYTFYVGRDGSGQVQAYVMIVPELFGTCFHKYAVGLKPDGEVIDVAIVELSCPRAMPVNRRSFLKQFKKKTHKDALTTLADVDAVTGATLSSETTARATRKATSLYNLLIGRAEPANTSADIRAARKAGDARILKAESSGELADPKSGQAPAPRP
jgi:hypothetical protein